MHALLSAVAQLVMVADRVQGKRSDRVAEDILFDAQWLGGDISRTALKYRSRILAMADALDAISPGSCAGVRAALGGG